MCITLWGEWNVWVSKFICSMQYFNLCIFCFLFNVGLTWLTTHLMCPFLTMLCKCDLLIFTPFFSNSFDKADRVDLFCWSIFVITDCTELIVSFNSVCRDRYRWSLISSPFLCCLQIFPTRLRSVLYCLDTFIRAPWGKSPFFPRLIAFVLWHSFSLIHNYYV